MIYVQPRESSRDPKFVTLINGPVNGQLIDRGYVKVDQSPRNATDCPHKHDDLEPYLTALHPSTISMRSDLSNVEHAVSLWRGKFITPRINVL